MATYGLTSTGFNAKAVDQIIADINAACRNGISPTLNLSAASALGQLIGIVGADLGELWDLAQAIYSSLNPDQATGDQLSSLALLTGTVKRAATFSAARACVVNVAPGTYLPGTLVAYVSGNPSATFANASTVTNGGGSAGNFIVDFEATISGPVLAPAGTLTVIATPVSGWNSVTNPTDAVAGLPLETDPQLRVRRSAELQTSGAATADAIRSDILTQLGTAVGGDVIGCTVLWNDSDVTDANGLPPHSFESIVLGVLMDSAANTALAKQLLASKTAGDRAYGSSSVEVLDSQNNSHTIGFTRPTLVTVFISLTVKRDPQSTTVVSADDIKAAIVSWSQSHLLPGSAVVIERIKSVTMDVVGVYDVTSCFVSLYPTPDGIVNLPISVRQIASISSANITVTLT